jgi:hypothetical protein
MVLWGMLSSESQSESRWRAWGTESTEARNRRRSAGPDPPRVAGGPTLLMTGTVRGPGSGQPRCGSSRAEGRSGWSGPRIAVHRGSWRTAPRSDERAGTPCSRHSNHSAWSRVAHLRKWVRWHGWIGHTRPGHRLRSRTWFGGWVRLDRRWRRRLWLARWRGAHRRHGVRSRRHVRAVPAVLEDHTDGVTVAIAGRLHDP